MVPVSHPHPQTLLAQNPFTPTSTLAQYIMHASPFLAELVVVREWLHEIAPPPHHPEVTTGYWKFTKHNVMQGQRTGTGPKDGLVTDMDPDAVNMGNGRALAVDDAVREINVGMESQSRSHRRLTGIRQIIGPGIVLLPPGGTDG